MGGSCEAIEIGSVGLGKRRNCLIRIFRESSHIMNFVIFDFLNRGIERKILKTFLKRFFVVFEG